MERYVERSDKRMLDTEKMRILRKAGYSIYAIANTMGVSANEVFSYTKDIKPTKSIRMPKYHLTDEKIQELKWLAKLGFTRDEMARHLQVSEVCIMSNLAKYNIKDKQSRS
jgi:predicted transcriptional regulator